MRITITLSIVLTIILLGEVVFAQGAKIDKSNWYPANIAAPSGHRYPCELTPLPRELTGIPAAEKTYINHIYSLVLRCLQVKLVMIDTIYTDRAAYSSAYTSYYSTTVACRQKIMSEPIPEKTLMSFRNDLVNALDKQVVFFRQASQERQAGKSSQAVMQIPAAREASGLLQQAYGKMASRYPTWSVPVQQSIYHHLCALDVF